MRGSDDMVDAMALAMHGIMKFRNKSIAWLMESLIALREGRYPTRSHENDIRRELKRRIPDGCLAIWNERRGLCPR